MTINVEIAKEFKFEAAHFLPLVEKSHKCRNLHGHSYTVIVKARGPLDPNKGWLMDLGEISQKFDPLKTQLDHSLLNNIDGLENPTSENIALWLFTRLKASLPHLFSITIEATNRVSVTISRDSFV